MKKIVCASFLSTWLVVLSLKVILKAWQFWSSEPQLVWISETQDLRNRWACCALLPLHPPAEKFKCRSTFTQTLVTESMSVSKCWLWNVKPKKNLTKLACGKADLLRGWSRTVPREAAFCGCYLPLLIRRWDCFMCSLLGVHSYCLNLWHTHFARNFSIQRANWPCLNLSKEKSILGAQLAEFWWEKGFLYSSFLCSSPFLNCDIKIQY